MKTHPNDSANPVQINGDVDSCNYGLTKREYFAALAIQGLLSNSSLKTDVKEDVETAVWAADALVEALNKESK